MSIDEFATRVSADVGPGYRLARCPGPVPAQRPLRPARQIRSRPKSPPLPATAKSVISLFMQGGPSQVDTFDPKPLLTKLHGQHPPDSFGNEDFQNGKFRDIVILGSSEPSRSTANPASKSPICSRIRRRRSTISRSIRSCYHEGFTHSQAQFLINNGWPRIGRPEPRLVDPVRTRQREPESAGLRRAARRRRPVRSGGLRAGLSAGGVPGHVLPPGPQSDSQSHAARGHEDRSSSATCSPRCEK